MSKVIKVNKLDEKIIQSINKKYAYGDYVIEIANTKGVTSDLLKKFNHNIRIRIVGGYTEKVLNNRSYKKSFEEATTYSISETIRMVEKMEEFEKGIRSDWSQIQKTAYIYNKLKGYIIYDPEYEEKDKMNQRQADSEMRSLRALISRKCVCAGYALVLKEMLDRQGIENEYVIGGTVGHPGNHAWLIVKINGRSFPLDLTWDAGRNARGNASKSTDNFLNVEKFVREHIPDSSSETIDYEKELSGLSKSFVESLMLPLKKDEQYTTTTYRLNTNDGSKVFIAQMGEENAWGRKLYKYAYVRSDAYGRPIKPLILTSTVNVAGVVHDKESYSDEYVRAIDEQLFSRYNIEDSLSRGSNYIGELENTRNYPYPYEVRKNPTLLNYSRINARVYTRSDGSEFILQKKPFSHFVNGTWVYEYEFCEFIQSYDSYNWEYINDFKKYSIFSEQDFFQGVLRGFSDEFMSRERLARMSKENGGYVGEYTLAGKCRYNPELKKFFRVKRTNWTKEDVERYPKEMKVMQTFTRSDGTTFSLKRVNRNPREVGKNHIIQYEYTETVKKKGGGTIKRRKQIFSNSDLFDVLRYQWIIDTEFSIEKLSDDNLLKTGRYLGEYSWKNRRFEFSGKTSEILRENRGIDFSKPDYPKRIKRIVNRNKKTIKRSDGTSFKLKRVAEDREITVHGRKMYQYEYVEDVKVAPWIREREERIIFSEEDLLKENRQEVIDTLLSQKRIKKRCDESGGYLGFFDKKGILHVNPKRSRFFRTYPRDFRTYPQIYTVNEQNADIKTIDTVSPIKEKIDLPKKEERERE